MAQRGADSVAIVDIGSSKICCLIAAIDSEGDAQITGVGHLGSAGIEDGLVHDMDPAQSIIGRVVQQAETMAGHVVEQVVLVTSGGHLGHDSIRVEVSAAGHAIERGDVAKAIRLAVREAHAGAGVSLHAIPACFSIDGRSGIRNPEGLLGEKLSLDVCLQAIEERHFGNLHALADQVMLDVPAVISSGYASAQACLHDEEKENGAACVDLGGGISSTAIFCGSKLVFGGNLLLGSDRITQTLARRLSLPMMDADRLKKQHGRVWQRDADFKEVITIPQKIPEGGIEQADIRKARLIGLMRPDVEEILSGVAEQLRSAGFSGRNAGPVVLTGGGAQLQGINLLAEQILGCPVRLGFPQRYQGLPTSMRGPAFAGMIGALTHVLTGERDDLTNLADRVRKGASLNGPTPIWPKRVLKWLRDAW
ncbi:MAG: cell division protein FtsA [Pseudomonadota bacterium]